MFVQCYLYVLTCRRLPTLAMRQLGGSLIRILIVDDHHQFRARLRNLIESIEDWEVCAEAQNGVEAVEKHWYIQPHVTVMDFNMPDLNGLLASREILRKSPDATTSGVTQIRLCRVS
jgi:DNA-binding NarL/FixJ family response regulator